MQDYISQSASGGCFVQDKLFTDFSYTGGGGLTPSLVKVDTIFSALPGQDIHGFLVSPVQGQPVWTVGFGLGYTIAVSPPVPGVLINSAKLQLNLGNLPPNPATGVSTKSNGAIQSVSFGDESETDIFAGVTSLTSSTNVSIPAGGFVASLEETYTQQVQVVVPEAGTSFLIGGGFLALALIRRRRPLQTNDSSL